MSLRGTTFSTSNLLDDSRETVRALRQRVAFAHYRPVELGEPRRVGDARVDLHHVVVELRGESFEQPLHDSAVIGGQIDAVDEMRAVAAVAQCGLGPAFTMQVAADFSCFPDSGGVLGVGRRDVRRSLRVAVEEKTATTLDIVVAGERV